MKFVAATALAFLMAFGAARADDTVSPERMALAKEVMTLSGALKSYDNFDANMDALLAQVLEGMPNPDPSVLVDLKKMAKEEFQTYKPQMIDGALTIYARHFSESDLKALIAFYKTDAGQHFATELPAVSKECMQLSVPFMRHYMGRVQKYVAEKIAAQKAALDKDKDHKGQ